MSVEDETVGEPRERRRRRTRHKRKRPSKKVANFLYEVRWLLLALVVGIPFLGVLFASIAAL